MSMYSKKIKIIFILLLLCLLNVFTIFSQTKNTKKADQYFKNYEYISAIEEYKELLKDNSNKLEKAYINFKMAECYRLINDFQKAELWYNRALISKYNDSISNLYLADIKLRNQKYTDADSLFKNYLKLFPNHIRAKKGLASCSLAVSWTNNPTRYKVENMISINTKESEFCPVYGNDKYYTIYFSSTKQGINGENISNVNGQNFASVFETSIDKKEKWGIPVSLSGSINSVLDNCCNSINYGTETIYLTRGKYTRNIMIQCKLYKSRKVGEEDWNTAEMITIANDTISVAHPSVTMDELTIYFSSDMTGGIGGTDIWMVTRSDKSKPWSKPVNLGSDINSSGNEMFPYIREDGKLYFSSDGFSGMGGLDIFCAIKNDKGWTVENMKFPINSSGDDYGIVFKGTQEEGLFTSTRSGGKGSDDIYSFTLPVVEFFIQGSVKDEQTGKQIVDYNISIVGSDGTDYETSSMVDGTFKIKLNPSADYIYMIRKEGYITSKGKVSTKGLNDNKIFNNEIKLKSLVNKK